MDPQPEPGAGSPVKWRWRPSLADIVFGVTALFALYVIKTIPKPPSPSIAFPAVIVQVPLLEHESKQELCNRLTLPQTLCDASRIEDGVARVVLRTESRPQISETK